MFALCVSQINMMTKIHTVCNINSCILWLSHGHNMQLLIGDLADLPASANTESQSQTSVHKPIENDVPQAK